MSVWELYLNKEIDELPVSSDIDTVIPSSDKGKELTTIKNTLSTFNPSILEDIINSFEKKDTSLTNSNLEILEHAEHVSLKAEDYELKYLYGHIVRLIKTGNELDLYIDAKTNSLAEKFNDSYKSLQLSETINATGKYQKSCKSYSDSLASLEKLAQKRGIDINISPKMYEQWYKFRKWDIDCDKIQTDLDAHIDEYRALQPVENNIKILKKLKRPVSRRFGLFKGYILKACSKQDYIAGIERCEDLSKEMDYAKENLDEFYRNKQDIESRLETMKDLSNDFKSYIIPLSMSQLLKLSRLSDMKYESTGKIYFELMEDELKKLSEKSREVIQTIMNNQKSYLLEVQDVLSKTLVKNISNFNDVDSMINIVDSKTQELKEYLSHIDWLGLSLSQSNNLIIKSDAQLKKLIESKGAYTQLGKNIQSLETLEFETNKNGLSEARLNTLGSIVQDSKTILEIPMSTLKKQYEIEHKEYKKKIDQFIDNVIRKIDDSQTKYPVGTAGSEDILKYYEKINTFRDISQKVKDYKNLVAASKKVSPHNIKPIYLDVEPIRPIVTVNKSCLVDNLGTLTLPDDLSYAVINDILRGKTYSSGWIDKMNQLNTELDKLKQLKNLSSTDYVLNVAEMIKESYDSGYLTEVVDASPKNKKILESTIDRLYSFGRSVAVKTSS